MLHLECVNINIDKVFSACRTAVFWLGWEQEKDRKYVRKYFSVQICANNHRMHACFQFLQCWLLVTLRFVHFSQNLKAPGYINTRLISAPEVLTLILHSLCDHVASCTIICCYFWCFFPAFDGCEQVDTQVSSEFSYRNIYKLVTCFSCLYALKDCSGRHLNRRLRKNLTCKQVIMQ